MAKYTIFKPGMYDVITLKHQHALGREVFDSIEGTLEERNISLEGTTDKDIVNIHQRPQYTPHIMLFQYKVNGRRNYVFTEILHCNDPFLEEFEKFLREKAVDAIGDEEKGLIQKGYENHWKTPFTLISCNVRKLDYKIKDANSGLVLENIGEVEIFEGVDYDDPVTYRVIHPDTMETKFREIENNADFTLKIERGFEEIYKENLLYLETKRGYSGGSVDHLAFRRKPPTKQSKS